MEQQEHTAEAVHLTDGDNHIVGVKSIRVFISQDGDMWFAQGLDIDYAACGETVEATKANFQTGIKKTISEYLKIHGSIDKFLKSAPQESWSEYHKTDANIIRHQFSDLQFHDLCGDEADKGKCFPFNQIEFIETELAA